jgi:hypothetical protein
MAIDHHTPYLLNLTVLAAVNGGPFPSIQKTKLAWTVHLYKYAYSVILCLLVFPLSVLSIEPLLQSPHIPITHLRILTPPNSISFSRREHLLVYSTSSL